MIQKVTDIQKKEMQIVSFNISSLWRDAGSLHNVHQKIVRKQNVNRL